MDFELLDIHPLKSNYREEFGKNIDQSYGSIAGTVGTVHCVQMRNPPYKIGYGTGTTYCMVPTGTYKLPK